nr:MAG TPA: tail protein [Caudoviricetes sp.]
MANKAISTLAVGSSVYLNVGGVRKEFLVVHQGLPSSLYDASCDGTWLLMKDIYEKKTFNSSNLNAYETSEVNTYLNGPFFSLFDSNIQGIIKQVKIPHVKNGVTQSGANGLSCKVFLLSGYEVGFTTSDNSYFPVDGAKLDYFTASYGGNSKRIAYLNGSATIWWLRSPYTYNSQGVWTVTVEGTGTFYNAFDYLGIRPALILPSTTLVDDSGNVVTVDLTAHKTLVGGTAYTVKGGKCMVNGTVYSIKKGRTLIGGTGYDIAFAPPYDPVFANNTWEQIIEACHNNEVPDTWKVADHKPMTINGVDYQIDIIGKNHDTYSDGSGKAPLTFQLHDCYGELKNMNSSNTNRGGWTSCAMRQTHLPAILSQMPTEVQSGIREVNKLTSAGNQSATIDTTADKLFLLSEIEIFGSISYSKSGEGAQYDYYKAGNSRVKNYNGSALTWWERSPNGGQSLHFCSVSGKGYAAYDSANRSFGVAFGFCF